MHSIALYMVRSKKKQKPSIPFTVLKGNSTRQLLTDLNSIDDWKKTNKKVQVNLLQPNINASHPEMSKCSGYIPTFTNGGVKGRDQGENPQWFSYKRPSGMT